MLFSLPDKGRIRHIAKLFNRGQNARALSRTQPWQLPGLRWINIRRGLEVGDDITENVSYGSAEQGHDDDDHNGHQHENQRVFNEPLALFICKKHMYSSFPHNSLQSAEATKL